MRIVWYMEPVGDSANLVSESETGPATLRQLKLYVLQSRTVDIFAVGWVKAWLKFVSLYSIFMLVLTVQVQFMFKLMNKKFSCCVHITRAVDCNFGCSTT